MTNFDLLDSQNYILNEHSLYETIQKYFSDFINYHAYFFFRNTVPRGTPEETQLSKINLFCFTGTVQVKFDQTSKQYKQMIPQLSSYLDSNLI